MLFFHGSAAKYPEVFQDAPCTSGINRAIFAAKSSDKFWNIFGALATSTSDPSETDPCYAQPIVLYT